MIKLKQFILSTGVGMIVGLVVAVGVGIIVGLVVAGLVQYWRLASGVLGLLP
jgi:hypothetical protein